MERKVKIHFANAPFMARVPEYGSEPIECTPTVYDAPSNCGVGITYPDGTGHVWGMLLPRNLIAAWRGTEVLRLLDVIENGTLHDAYCTGVRHPHESDLDRTINPMIARIGQKAYDRIMAMFVPEEIVRAILDNQNDSFKPDLYPIAEEVKAGTIQWRQEFAEAGIKHPDETEAEAEQQKRTIARFENLLCSYADSTGLPRECLGTGYIEGALLTIVGRGADKVHPDRVVVALAGVVGHLATSELTMFMMPVNRNARGEMKQALARQKDEALEKAARWLITKPSKFGWLSPFIWLFSGRKNSPSLDDTKALLNRLLEEYFPPKQSNEEAA